MTRTLAQINQQFTINSLKYNYNKTKTWTAELIGASKDTIELVGVFDEDVKHSKLGVIRRGTVSHEYYWFEKWFNVFRFDELSGEFRNFYCNVSTPPTVKGNTLEYIDLDLDIIVWADMSYEIVDLDEFEENSIRFGYSDHVKVMALRALEDLKTMLENREFPFDI